MEIVPQGAHDGGAGAHHVARGRAGEQVQLAAAHPVVLAEADLLARLVRPHLGQRAQGLGGDAPGGDDDVVVAQPGQVGGPGALAQERLGHDRQLPAPRGDDAAVESDRGKYFKRD